MEYVETHMENKYIDNSTGEQELSEALVMR